MTGWPPEFFQIIQIPLLPGKTAGNRGFLLNYAVFVPLCQEGERVCVGGIRRTDSPCQGKCPEGTKGVGADSPCQGEMSRRDKRGRDRRPQRPAMTAAPPKRADEDIGPYGVLRWCVRRADSPCQGEMSRRDKRGRGRCPHRPATTGALPKRAAGDSGPYGRSPVTKKNN